MEEGVQEKDRQFVNALAQGLEILRAFPARRGPLTLRELSERTQLPRQAVQRLTDTLVELKCLTSEAGVSTFALAPGVLSLGYRVLANADMGERVSPILDDLARSTGCVATLAAVDDAEIIFMRIARGDAAVSVRFEVGLRIPAAKSSSAAAILAGSSDQRRRAMLEELRNTRSREEYAEIAAAVERGIEEFRELGCCTAIGCWRPDVKSIAAPIIGVEGEARFALGLAAPMGDGSTEGWPEEHAAKLVGEARRLSFFDGLDAES